MASLMHAIDRFRRPRAESVLSDSELAGISVPTTFVLGPEDPYLSVEDARPSIDRIPGAQLHVMPGGHAPWLADPDHAARLVTSRLTAEWVPPEGA
jgi:pimeloyl-ACP methyl ester carboxylesterase